MTQARERGGTKTLLIGLGVAVVLVVAAYIIAVGGFGTMRGSESPREGGNGGTLPYAPASMQFEAPSIALA